MDEYLIPGINFVSNVIMTFAFTLFLIFVFGRKESKINQMSFFGMLIPKVALAFCTAGTLTNAITMSSPPLSEVILNVGLAILFIWAAWFHWKFFVNKDNTNSVKKRMAKKKTR